LSQQRPRSIKYIDRAAEMHPAWLVAEPVDARVSPLDDRHRRLVLDRCKPEKQERSSRSGAQLLLSNLDSAADGEAESAARAGAAEARESGFRCREGGRA
jgi:hypothetical protein